MCTVDFTVRLWLLHPFSQEITSSMTLRGREYYTVEDDSQSIHGQTQTHHALCNMVLDTMNTPCYNEPSKAVLLILIRAPRTARLSIWSLSNFDSAKYNNILNQARWVCLKSLSAYRRKMWSYCKWWYILAVSIFLLSWQLALTKSPVKRPNC